MHLALSAGWFSYVAHAAFLVEVRRAGHRITSLSGASSGAMAAALIAVGLEDHEIKDLVCSVQRSEIMAFRPGLGLFSARRLEETLRRKLGDLRFESLSIPLAVSLGRFPNGRVVVHREGDLAKVLHAAIAVPGFFRPVVIDGHRWLDGGWRDPLALAGAPDKGPILVHDLRRDANGIDGSLPIQVQRIDMPGRLRFGPSSMDRAEAAWAQAQDHARKALFSEAFRKSVNSTSNTNEPE